MTSGGRCVMMTGTSGMLRWCAEPWTVVQPRQPSLVPILVQAKEISGWTMWTVRVMRHPRYTARMPILVKTTVAMARTPAWYAQVSGI